MTKPDQSRHSARRAFVWRGLCFMSAVLALTAMAPSRRAGVPAIGRSPALRATIEPPSSATKQDTSLCRLISAKEYFGVLKAPVGSIRGRSATIAGNPTVTCYYRPPKMPGAGGSITYIFPSNAAAYYALLQQDDKNNLNKVTTLTGVGDAAYWGTQVNSDDALELTMRKGKVIVGLLFDGTADDGSVYLAGAEQVAKEIAAHF